MNKFGKFLLVVTSLAPILLAYCVNAYSNSNYLACYFYAISGVGFCAICLLVLYFCKRQLPIQKLNVTKVKSVDKQALAFLVIYLVPLFSDNALDFQSHPVLAAYVLLIVGLVVYHSNAFTFNPILALMWYHFYEVETDDGMTYLLISRQLIRKQSNEYKVVEIADYMFMDRE